MSGNSPEEQQKNTADANRWKALAAITLPLIMISIDVTILNVALPSISKALSTTSVQLVWINSGYIIVFGSIIMLAGSLADKFGRKLILMIGMVVFISGSILSGLSVSPNMLIFSRMIQGLGGGLVAPATLSLITAIFLDTKERARAIGVWAGFSGIGVAVGPILGGLLLTAFYWGSVFFINVPVVLAGLILIFLWVPESRNTTSPPIDFAGALFSILGLLGLFYFFIEAPRLGFSNSIVLGSIILGPLFLVAFIVLDLRKRDPLLDPRLFKKPAFTASVITIMVAFFAFLGLIYEVTLYLQSVLGFSPLKAGFALSPLALVLLVLASKVPAISEKYGNRATVVLGLFLIAAGVGVFATVSLTTTIWLIIFAFVLIGAGIALAQVPSSAAIQNSVPVNEASMGSATNNAMRQIASSLGIAVVGGIGQAVYSSRLQASGALRGLTSNQASQALSSIDGAIATGSSSVIKAADEAFIAGLHQAALLTVFVVVLGAAVAYFIVPKSSDDGNSDTRVN